MNARRCLNVQIRPPARRSAVAVLVLAFVALLGSCSGSDSADGPELSAEALQGKAIAKDQGCMSCHSPDGRRSVGPTWQGLYGSEVELDDGETVVADEDYLRTAIGDPSAQLVKGFPGTMPDRDLSADEIDSVIAYIRTLGAPPQD